MMNWDFVATFSILKSGTNRRLWDRTLTAHPSTVSVPITILLYNGPLLCGFNVPIKGLTTNVARKW